MQGPEELVPKLKCEQIKLEFYFLLCFLSNIVKLLIGPVHFSLISILNTNPVYIFPCVYVWNVNKR